MKLELDHIFNVGAFEAPSWALNMKSIVFSKLWVK